jgi:hypothetical protein
VADIRILAVGAPEFTDQAAVEWALGQLDALYIHGAAPEEITLVYGDEKSVDFPAAAAQLGWGTERHEADSVDGDAAGFIRDRDMIRRGANYVVALGVSQSVQRCQRLAAAADIHVITIHQGARDV